MAAGSAAGKPGGLPADATVVAIAPDSGERCLDTIYNDAWVSRLLPEIPAGGHATTPG